MEFFNKAMAVKLRSHLDKYVVADDDKQTVRQSRNSSSRKTIWEVEKVEGKNETIRLKSCHGKYLKASELPFLMGVTGNKVIQTELKDEVLSWLTQWEPIRDGFQVRLRSWCGTYLRGNGGTPPWRNSITHDEPHSNSPTRNWVLWDVQSVEVVESATETSLLGHLWSMSSLNSVVSSDDLLGSDPCSPPWTGGARLSSTQSNISFTAGNFHSGMDLFHKAKAVRLRSHHNKYLFATVDEDSVTQNRNGASKNTRWTVEYFSLPEPIIRLKSCYGKYLTASNQPFLLGMTGRKVVQALPKMGVDPSVEWEPVREGNRVMLKTRDGDFLRANGGVPPWRNSVTHDVPNRSVTHNWILWDVDVVEIIVQSPGDEQHDQTFANLDGLNCDSSSLSPVSIKSEQLSRAEFPDCDVSSPSKSKGRTIYYHVAEDNDGVNDEATESYSFTFNGNGIDELTRKLKEKTGLEGFLVCTRSPLNRKLYPLRLQLPPNNSNIHVVLVLKSSQVARDFEKQGVL